MYHVKCEQFTLRFLAILWSGSLAGEADWTVIQIVSYHGCDQDHLETDNNSETQSLSLAIYE
jgi:hypothetical protein